MIEQVLYNASELHMLDDETIKSLTIDSVNTKGCYDNNTTPRILDLNPSLARVFSVIFENCESGYDYKALATLARYDSISYCPIRLDRDMIDVTVGIRQYIDGYEPELCHLDPEYDYVNLEVIRDLDNLGIRYFGPCSIEMDDADDNPDLFMDYIGYIADESILNAYLTLEWDHLKTRLEPSRLNLFFIDNETIGRLYELGQEYWEKIYLEYEHGYISKLSDVALEQLRIIDNYIINADSMQYCKN